MNNKLQHELVRLGFTANEAAVYLSCLELGTAKMTDIARRSETKRPTTYLIIEELLKKNLITRIQKGKIDYYKPSDPSLILQDQLEKTKLAQRILPNLKKTFAGPRKTKVTFYEGKRQLEHIHDVMFRSKQLSSIVYLDQYWKLFGDEHNRHIYELLKRSGGMVRALMPKTRKNIEHVNKKYRTGLQEVRFLPETFDTANQASILYNDKQVVYLSYTSVTATSIEDENILNVHSQMFEHLWRQSEPFKKQP